MELYEIIDHNDHLNRMRVQNAKALNELSAQIRPLREQVKKARKDGKPDIQAEMKLNNLIGLYADRRKFGVMQIMAYKNIVGI